MFRKWRDLECFALRSLWTQLTENVPPNILSVILIERAFEMLAQKHLYIIHETF